MKRITILLILSGLFYQTVFSQRVDSVKVEQSGDFIKVGYRILESVPGQVYRVKMLCSINGGLYSELRSISGDIGDQVAGGKPEYWAVWDVLKDVEDVRSVDFVVRAELVSDNTRGRKNSKIFNFQGAVQFPGPTFGARTSFMGRFGVSFQFARGMAVLLEDPLYTEEPVFNRFSIDLTSRLFKQDQTELHLLTGVTAGNTVIREEYTSNTPGTSSGESYFKTAMTPGPEIGLSICTKRLIFTLSGTKLLTGLTEEGKSISKNGYIVFSAGFRL